MTIETEIAKGNAQNIKPTSLADHDDILRGARYYTDAIQTGDMKHFHEGFHPEATMYGWLEGSFRAGSAQQLYDIAQEHGPTPGFNSRFTIVTSTPTTAIVEVDTEYQGEGYRDHLILCKVGKGQWQTVTKIFHVYDSIRS